MRANSLSPVLTATPARSPALPLPLSLPPCHGRGTDAFEEFLHGAGVFRKAAGMSAVFGELIPLQLFRSYCLKPGRPLAGRSPGGMFKSNSDAVSREARITCGSPMPRGERIAKPAERAIFAWPALSWWRCGQRRINWRFQSRSCVVLSNSQNECGVERDEGWHGLWMLGRTS